MTSGRLTLLCSLLLAATNAAADPRATPTAAAEIEKYAGPYPGEHFATLKDIYRKYLRTAGFAESQVTRSLSYGPDGRHKLDVLQPEERPATPMPVLVFVHGGGFVRGERSDGEIFDNVLHFFFSA